MFSHRALLHLCLVLIYQKPTNMKCNVGTTDRLIRAIIGVGIIVAGIVTHSWLGAIGAVPLLTAALGWCPLYLPLGISTCQRAQKN